MWENCGGFGKYAKSQSTKQKYWMQEELLFGWWKIVSWKKEHTSKTMAKNVNMRTSKPYSFGLDCVWMWDVPQYYDCRNTPHSLLHLYYLLPFNMLQMLKCSHTDRTSLSLSWFSRCVFFHSYKWEIFRFF